MIPMFEKKDEKKEIREKRIKKLEEPLLELEKCFKKLMKEVDVDLDGATITLRPLGSIDETRAYIDTAEEDQKIFLRANKIRQLAYAMVAINGKRFELEYDNVGDKDKELEDEFFHRKCNIIESFPQGWVDDLFIKLIEIMNDVEEKFITTRARTEENKKAQEALNKKREEVVEEKKVAEEVLKQ